MYYTLIGGGRLAHHMHRYFQLLEIPHNRWQRAAWSNPQAATEALSRALEPASHVLLLIRDDAIAGFIDQHPELRGKTLIHCSGSLVLEGVSGVHPLMTFGEEDYDLDTYRSIPMVCERGGADFHDLFPALPNPVYQIGPGDRARYHALCVLAGNCSQILWQACGGEMRRLGLPETVLRPYLRKVCENYIQTGADALTGPLVRGDQHTMDANLRALRGSPLAALYAVFVDIYHQRREVA